MRPTQKATFSHHLSLVSLMLALILPIVGQSRTSLEARAQPAGERQSIQTELEQQARMIRYDADELNDWIAVKPEYALLHFDAKDLERDARILLNRVLAGNSSLDILKRLALRLDRNLEKLVRRAEAIDQGVDFRLDRLFFRLETSIKRFARTIEQNTEPLVELRLLESSAFKESIESSDELPWSRQCQLDAGDSLMVRSTAGAEDLLNPDYIVEGHIRVSLAQQIGGCRFGRFGQIGYIKASDVALD